MRTLWQAVIAGIEGHENSVEILLDWTLKHPEVEPFDVNIIDGMLFILKRFPLSQLK